ncbi:hypothetical protein V6N00_13095 [Tersicoccus sp. MR15.9]|uniref:hypothetical protein n=1 Tax=Tersicoccus mangrovi TaxID=3121635 RepID=UPI002FE5A1AE
MSTGLKVLGGIVATVLVIGALVVAGLALGWFGRGAHVISAGNVEKQYGVVIGQYNDMIAAAENACTAQASAKKTTSKDDAQLFEDPTTARAATFRSLVAKYSATVDNPFEGQIVVPPGYPTSAGLHGLDTKDWCTVSGQLQELRGR